MDNVQAFRGYLALEKKYSLHTVNAYLQDIQFFTDFLEAEFGDADLVSVKYPQIRNWIVQLVDSGVANRSVNRKVSSLKAFYNFC